MSSRYSDGIHSAATFTFKKSCTVQELGTLVYTWTVPKNLDTKVIYQFGLRTNGSDEKHLSGPFRIEEQEKQAGSRMMVIYGLVGLALMLAAFSRWLLRYHTRRRQEENRIARDE